VLNHIYQRKNAKGGVEYFWPDDVENTFGDGGRITGARLKTDGSLIEYAGVGTMSKSKNNGVDPQALIDKYGADTARLFVMFASPPEQTLEWSDSGVEGASRFLRRLWSFCHGHQDILRKAGARTDAQAVSAPMKELRFEIHSVLRQSTYDFERKQYNTVVSGAMKMLNALDAAAAQLAPPGAGMPAGDAAVLRECTSILLRSLYPVVPHVTHALWEDLAFGAVGGSAGGDPVDLVDAPWPVVDEAALVRETQELVLQVNGKVRGSLQLPADADRALIEARAGAAPEVLRLAEGRAPKRIVIVPGRLVNVVV
jgi:leucyl-tRNA synthetase